MLVITRKLEERIILDDRISIAVLEMDGQRVKLGIDAPKEVAIYRQEIYEAIQEENQLAVNQAPEVSLLKQWVSQILKKSTKE